MHDGEFPVSLDLVHYLVTEQFPPWSDLPLQHVASAGTDNALFRLGKEMVVRLPRIDWAVAAVEREQHWLPTLAPSLPTSISAPLAFGKPSGGYPWHWAIYRWEVGENPTVEHIERPITLAKDLAAFIKALQLIDTTDAPQSNRGVPLSERDVDTRLAIAALDGIVDTAAVTSAWEYALKLALWTGPSVWVHGDLSPGNILVRNGDLAAVIDFGCFGIGDPCADLIIAWNLLPASVRGIFKSELNVDAATWERGRGLALSIALIQLPYYKDSNPTLAESARHVIREVLADHQVPLRFSS